MNEFTAGILTFGNKFLSVSDNKLILIDNLDKNWKFKKLDSGKYQISYGSKNLGVDSTQFGSYDIRHLLYLTENLENYEQFFIGRTPNNLILAMIEYTTQGAENGSFAPVNLTVVL